MNLGIIGAGNMGGALGARWAAGGHSVLFSSRDRGKAEAVATRVARGAQAGDFDEAAAFGDVLLYTVRGIFPSVLLRHARALAGKVVIDCNNTDLDADMRPLGVDPNGPTLAEQLAADVPAARIVKAFSSIPHRVIELDRATLPDRGYGPRPLRHALSQHRRRRATRRPRGCYDSVAVAPGA